MALIKPPIKRRRSSGKMNAITGVWSVKDPQGVIIYDDENEKGKRAELLPEGKAWYVFLKKSGPDAILLKGGEKMAEKHPEYLILDAIALPPE